VKRLPGQKKGFFPVKNNMRITNIEAKEILNSAGNLTVECKITLSNGKSATASVPQGISVGDEEKKPVDSKLAIEQINKQILPILKKEIGLSQEKLDRVLEKGNWGSNATLSVSAAFAKCSDYFQPPKNFQPPVLLVLIFEGKKHGNKKLKMQEYMVVLNSVKQGRNFYKKAETFLEEKGDSVLVGSEGGFSPSNYSDEKVIKTITQLGADKIALDIAANTSPPSWFFLKRMIKRYPIILIEDFISEHKPEKWAKLMKKATKINPDILVVADDLTVTNPLKIRTGAEKRRFNAVVIKPNQQGTITKAIEAVNEARKHNLKVIVSHRGEDTNDSWIVDLAVFVQADFVKFGGFSRGERIAKYNRLWKLTS
jgi:enolase